MLIKIKKEVNGLHQFFMHDIIYGKYYRKAVDLRDVINFELSDCGCEELNINEVYDIFEVWSFFFMIKILVENVNWKSKENKNIIKNANHYMRKNKTLYGFYVDLEHELKDSTASLRIFYNKTIKVTMGGKEKYHYECNYCGNFWVKSHCFACACNKIVKHDLQEKQYHLLSGEKWMVKCPQCGDSGVRTALTDTHTANGYISDSRVNNINVKSIKTVNTNVIYNNNRVICSRCRGSGRISRYNHIENGVCFACNGTGYVFSRF